MPQTFIPEDGTGVADANAYVTLAYARAHHEARDQLGDWDGDEAGWPSVVADSVSQADDVLVVAVHEYLTGDGPVQLSGADLPAGIEPDTDYWLVVDGDEIQLAETYDDAVDEPPVVVDITDAGSGDVTITGPDFAAQRAAIVRATDYIEQVWGARFLGYKADPDQGLHWPANDAYLEESPGEWEAVEGVPVQVKRACAEYALRALSAPLTMDRPDGAVSREEVVAGPVRRDVTYAQTATMASYPTADRWLSAVVGPVTVERY